MLYEIWKERKKLSNVRISLLVVNLTDINILEFELLGALWITLNIVGTDKCEHCYVLYINNVVLLSESLK